MTAGSGEHFWGPIDAVHQFCEDKYVVSPFVAEFWNAATAIPAYVLPGLYALFRRSSHTGDVRVTLVWLSLVVMGFGSFMFHATMRFNWEMCDELPMFACVLSSVVAKDDVHWITSGWWKIFKNAFTVSLSVVAFCAYLHGGSYELFVACFTALCIINIALSFICTWRPDKHVSQVGRACALANVTTIAVARAFWEVEERYCVPGSGGLLPRFHIVWHVFSGLACYFGALADAHARHDVLGLGRAVDEPRDRWPLIGVFGSGWLRPVLQNGAGTKHD